MTRHSLWLLFDIALGVVVAGVLAPLAILLVPDRLRGSWALGGIALVAIVTVAALRRMMGIGVTDRSR